MKRILVAEDEKSLLNVLDNRLTEKGWEVIPAQTGQEAIDKLQEGEFDMIVLDILMPDKTGFDVLKEIRSIKKLKNVPILVLSNLGADEDVKEAMKLGASDFFIKAQHPIDEVLEKIETLSI